MAGNSLTPQAGLQVPGQCSITSCRRQRDLFSINSHQNASVQERGGIVEGAFEGNAEDGSEGTAENTFEGASEGSGVGPLEGASEGSSVGPLEGASEGSSEGALEGASEGSSEGALEGASEGSGEGALEGASEGSGASLGLSVGGTLHIAGPWHHGPSLGFGSLVIGQPLSLSISLVPSSLKFSGVLPAHVLMH